MASVVAMASVIEDFDTQPCKKSRKDGGAPVVKTITNYFSPVAKPAEKPFSPPRSNNIMDYFTRKPPSSSEKSSPSEQSKENCLTSTSAEKVGGAAAAAGRLKRSRKAIKAARKLVEEAAASQAEEESFLILDGPLQSKDSVTEVTGSCGSLGCGRAAVSPQLSAEESKTVTDRQDNISKSSRSEKPGEELKSIKSSSEVIARDKTKRVKTASRNLKKRHQAEVKPPEPEMKEAESPQCDVNAEGEVDQASELNKSTVTISFEDFLHSQGLDHHEEQRKDEEKTSADAESQLKNVDSGEPVLQVSPRTLTIQAEVHTVSPKQEAKTVGKMASIFNNRKQTASHTEDASSPQMETRHQSPSDITIKRKSNVVLQEEDLELAVLESESTPKCSEVDRKQFMAAFKRPNMDGSKSKPGKTQSKQKQPRENNPMDQAESAAEEKVAPPPAVETVPAESEENKQQVDKKKLSTKGRKRKAKNEVQTDTTVSDPGPAAEAPPPAEDTNIDSDVKNEEPTLRRSKREALVRQAPDVTPARAVRKNRTQRESKDVQKTPEKMSTPETPRRKHGVFVAKMVAPPDAKESPIRMKFIRVQRNVSKVDADRGRGGHSPMTPDKENKKRKKAKQLVEKAKVMQQSKRAAAAAATEEKSAPRRSSRHETTSSKSYCEDEDSIICLEDSPSASSPSAAPEKSKSQKSLRSLNDVLGKATSSGSKEKTARKTSAVISIFDDSSREGSENSQDDEQFRARREFLKSGLPESFRKQIAKTAATKEAYSLSCSSFTPVAHIRQQPNDCPLWTLSWPSSSLLSPLKELWGQASVSHPPVSGSLYMKTEPAQRTVCKKLSGWRPEISESVRQLLLEEIRTSNPSFPAQMFISRFLKRRADQQQHHSTSGPSETAQLITGKRKRMDDEEETAVKVPKKQRGNRTEENVSKPEPQATKRGRLRRAKSSKPEEEKDKIETKDDSVIVLDDLPLVQDTVEKDVAREDVLWTEKYQPQHSTDIMGNSPSLKRLHSWLREWKLRADREERKKQKDAKQEEESNDSDWELGEGSMDGEDLLCNTMLITGPTGVGKTAAVYACAQELGFKVFEVNASSQRSGRLILSQLREATQSHQVDSQGVNAHKPTYFNSYGASSSTGAVRLGSSPRKVNSPRRVVSSPRKRPQSPRGAKRGSLAPTSLASFFKMGRPTNKEPQNAKKSEQTAVTKKTNNDVNKLKGPAQKPTPSPKEKSEEQSRKTATSLILFEEVDVIFEEDSGFLAAIKTFMTTTKRPVILTTSDPAFSSMFDGNFEEILFKTPTLPNVSSYLQLLCLAEDVRTDLSDIDSLLRLNGCDIRQSLLQLQFYTRTAGGRHVSKPLNHLHNNAEAKAELGGEAKEACVVALPPPPCETGCTESMLGLRNVQPEQDIWELLKSQSLKEDVYWELLVNGRRQGADLLYTNLERLLPLPLTTLAPRASSLPKPDQAAESGDCSDNGSPVKVSQTTKNKKKKQGLLDRNRLNLDSDSEDDFMTLPKPQVTPQNQEDVSDGLIPETVKRKVLTPEERLKSLPVSQCLDSVADFFDNMSYLDSCVLACPYGGAAERRVAAGAVLKDGMTDERRFETNRESWTRGGHVLEIQAAVEALSFHKCRDSVAKAWGKVQELDGELRKEATEEVTLPVASHRQGYSFSPDGPCSPQLVQRRREMMESLLLQGVVSLGNRAAAAVDYLPVLRDICRTEQLKEKGKIKRRFLHYLDAVHLGLTKTTLQYLAEDFP